MRSRAWRSTLSAVILMGFTVFDLIGLVSHPDLAHFVWLYLVGMSTIVESISAYFWYTYDLRAPMWSGINQFWLGILVCCNSIWDGLHPENMTAMLNHMPIADFEKTQAMAIMRPLYFPVDAASGVLVLLAQILIAYQFWTGGPRGYRPKLQRSRNSEPASE